MSKCPHIRSIVLKLKTKTWNLNLHTHSPRAKHRHQSKNGPTPRLKWIGHTNNKAPQHLTWKKEQKCSQQQHKHKQRPCQSVSNSSTYTYILIHYRYTTTNCTHHGRRTGNDRDVRLDAQSRLGQTSTRNEPQKNCTNTSKRGCRQDKNETEFPEFPEFQVGHQNKTPGTSRGPRFSFHSPLFCHQPYGQTFQTSCWRSGKTKEKIGSST